MPTLTIKNLDSRMEVFYPDTTSEETQNKRQFNISAFRTAIDDAKVKNTLAYAADEERLFLYSTSAGEQVVIQFPGKESVPFTMKKGIPTPKAPKEIRQYDFRPKIILADGTVLPDMTFSDMWSVVEELSKTYPKILRSLSSLFFQLGRMILHEKVAENINYSIIDSACALKGSGTIDLEWYKLKLPDDILEAFNFHVEELIVDNGSHTISFEAFLYFFDLILQNEDIKYNDKKGDLSSGRIQTSDSMLLLTSYFLGKTTLSVLLQRYVSGFGVAKCLNDEITPATDNLVHIVNRRNELSELLDHAGITYRTSTYITVNKIKYSVALKSTSLKIAVLKKSDSAAESALSAAGWTVYNFEDALDITLFAVIKNAFGV